MNVSAGAVRLRFWRFMAGMLFGMLPGIAAATLPGDRIAHFLTRPSPGGLVALAAIAVALIAVAHLVRRRLQEKTDRPP